MQEKDTSYTDTRASIPESNGERNARTTDEIFISKAEQGSASFGKTASNASESSHSVRLHTKKSARELLRYDEEISVADAFGKKDTLPSVIKKSPSLIQRLWGLFFGGLSLKIPKLHRRDSAGIDRVLVMVLFIIVCIGSVMVFSASYAFAETRYGNSLHFVRKQILFVLGGIIIMIAASFITPDFYKLVSRSFFAVSLLLLVLVLLIGFAGNGAQRWLQIGPISFQPSEVAKLSLVLILAWYFSVFEDRATNYSNKRQSVFYGIIYPFLLIGITAGLVMLEKHLSCLIILGCIGLIIMFASGSDGKVLGLICGGGLVSVAVMAVAIPYTRRRIEIWLDPTKDAQGGGWQTLQGLNAIGSGGFFGLGLGNSRMKYSYVSEPANDFIFTITCEELGFVGAAAIVALFAVFVIRGYHIARTNDDTFSRITAFGITTHIAVQVLLNIAVVTNVFPNTGIALPFFSYGGTSLLILFLEMGILLSVSRGSHLKYR